MLYQYFTITQTILNLLTYVCSIISPTNQFLLTYLNHYTSLPTFHLYTNLPTSLHFTHLLYQHQFTQALNLFKM